MDNKEKIADQKGQSVVEFILLMLGVLLISFSFLSQVNTNVAERWERIANVIVDDQSRPLRINQ